MDTAFPSQEMSVRWMFGAIRNTHARRPIPIVRISASISAAGSRRGFLRLTSTNSPAIKTGYTAR